MTGDGLSVLGESLHESIPLEDACDTSICVHHREVML